MDINFHMKFQKIIIIIFLFFGLLRGFSQENEYPYAADIRQFREKDSINPPPQHAILFAGSSSFAMWKDVQAYFPGLTIINRGFGGSTLLDQMYYVHEVIFPYSPRQIVIYCGENDLASGDTVTAAMVTRRFITLFNVIRSDLPDTRITYVSMKPSPSRWHLAEKFMAANQGIREFIESQPNTSFVNIWDDMLDHEGLPDTTLFLDDRLHMNANGYKIWQKAIKPELIN